MATKTFYATKDLKNPNLYGTRMLKAGEPVELDGPKARLYLRLGAVSPTKPRVARAAVPTVTTEDVAPASPAAPATPKAPRKRKRATAKK